MTQVRVSVALKRSIGYNSIQVGVDVEDDVPLDERKHKGPQIQEHLDRLYELASSKVDEKINEALSELKA